MGRPVKNDVVRGFLLWAVNGQKKSQATARNYAWYVRKVLSVLDNQEKEITQAVIYNVIENSFKHSSVSVARTAWNHFCTYAKQELGVTYLRLDPVPLITEQVYEEPVIVDHTFPLEIQQLINRWVSRSITVNSICLLRWNNLNFSKKFNIKGVDHISLLTPDGPYKIAVSDVRILLAWNNPGNVYDTLLFPHPSSTPENQVVCTTAFIQSQLQSLLPPIEDLLNQLTAETVIPTLGVDEVRGYETNLPKEVEELIYGTLSNSEEQMSSQDIMSILDINPSEATDEFPEEYKDEV